MEQNFAWETLEKEFVAVDYAVQDPELVKMSEACDMVEAHIRGNRITDPETLLEECRKLDQNVWHLIGQRVDVLGQVWPHNDDEEGDSFGVDMSMQFNGFIYSTRNDRVEIGYELVTAVDENEDLIDLRNIEEDTPYRLVGVKASRSDVRLDFDIVHQVQAAAWLNLMDENLVRQLDSYLLPGVVDADRLETIDDPYSLVSLNTIGQLEIDLAYLESSERTYHKTLQAINLYAEGCLSYDRIAPHRIDIQGDCLMSSGGNYTPTVLEERDRLVVINEVVLQRRGSDEGRFTFGFKGILIGEEADEPALNIITQFKNTRNIRSIR